MTRHLNTKTHGQAFSREIQELVWRKGLIEPGRDPELYRRDPFGKLIYRDSYAKTSELGWEIALIAPTRKDGNHDPANLQPLHWQSNRGKRERPAWFRIPFRLMAFLV